MLLCRYVASVNQALLFYKNRFCKNIEDEKSQNLRTCEEYVSGWD